MTSKISESMAKEIVGLLEERAQELWSSINWEFQDDAEFLLISIKLREKPLERNAPDRMYAYEVVEPRIPPKEDGSYSWMVVFTCEGDVCDSVMTGVP